MIEQSPVSEHGRRGVVVATDLNKLNRSVVPRRSRCCYPCGWKRVGRDLNRSALPTIAYDERCDRHWTTVRVSAWSSSGAERGADWSGPEELTSVLFPEKERSALVGPACDVAHDGVSQGVEPLPKLGRQLEGERSDERAIVIVVVEKSGKS